MPISVPLGEVCHDDKAVWSFYLRNTLERQIYIEKVVASCRCTQVKVERKAVEPNEAFAVAVRINRRLADRGKFDYSFYLHLSKPVDALPIRVSMKGVWSPPFEVSRFVNSLDPHDFPGKGGRIIAEIELGTVDRQQVVLECHAALLKHTRIVEGETGRLEVTIDSLEGVPKLLHPIKLSAVDTDAEMCLYEVTELLDLRSTGDTVVCVPRKICRQENDEAVTHNVVVQTERDKNSVETVQLIAGNRRVAGSVVDLGNGQFWKVRFDPREVAKIEEKDARVVVGYNNGQEKTIEVRVTQ